MPSGGKALSPADNDRIREFVKEFVTKQPTQEEAAKAMGIAQGTLSDFLGGNRGAGPKILQGIIKNDPRAAAVLFGHGLRGGPPDPLGGAVAALVEDGAGTQAEIAAAAVEAEEENQGRRLTLLGWVEVIRPILRRHRAAPDYSQMTARELAHAYLADNENVRLREAFCRKVSGDSGFTPLLRQQAAKAQGNRIAAGKVARTVIDGEPKRSATPAKLKLRRA